MPKSRTQETKDVVARGKSDRPAGLLENNIEDIASGRQTTCL